MYICIYLYIDFLITLLIKSSIINKDLEGYSCTINYYSKYTYDKEICQNNIKFDVKKPSPLSFWIMKEQSYFHIDNWNRAYFQSIMQFQINDKFEINVGIFNEKGFLKQTKTKQVYLNKGEVVLSTFKWNSLIQKPTSDFNFLNIPFPSQKGKEIVDFDVTRFCEFELLKNLWKKASRDIQMKTFQSLSKVFEPCFVIKDIFYDNIGYVIYKVVLIACSDGVIGGSGVEYGRNMKKNGLFNLGIIIKVKKFSESISNEAKKNNLIYDFGNIVECRVGDVLVYYFCWDIKD